MADLGESARHASGDVILVRDADPVVTCAIRRMAASAAGGPALLGAPHDGSLASMAAPS